MTTSKDFDYFLQNGFIENLSPGSSMNVLLAEFGDSKWITKEKELNGLICGIIKIGFIEFHIYNERVNGISYRPDLPFSKKEFDRQTIPWIYKDKEIFKVEENLNVRKIKYKRYVVKGPLETLSTAGAFLLGLEDCEHTFIDTEGGVTFLFEPNERTGGIDAYQICKYYSIDKQD